MKDLPKTSVTTINTELLERLYTINAPSQNTSAMNEFIHKWVIANIEDCIIEDDEYGNLYITKGTSDLYPCIVAHLDEVHNVEDRITLTINNDIYGFDVVKKEQCGIGGDDKNGIYIGLEALSRLDEVKVAFFIDEEIGCVGSGLCDMSFFDDCRYVLQCDRKGNSDFITMASGVMLCSEEFILSVLMSDFGYKEATGIMTDVMTLKENGLGVSCCNISCGYYNPHTSREYTSLIDLDNTLNFVMWICNNLTNKYLQPKYGNFPYDKYPYSYYDTDPYSYYKEDKSTKQTFDVNGYPVEDDDFNGNIFYDGEVEGYCPYCWEAIIDQDFDDEGMAICKCGRVTSYDRLLTREDVFDTVKTETKECSLPQFTRKATYKAIDEQDRIRIAEALVDAGYKHYCPTTSLTGLFINTAIYSDKRTFQTIDCPHSDERISIEELRLISGVDTL